MESQVVFQESRLFRWFSRGIRELPLGGLFSHERILSLGKWLLAGLLFATLFIPRFSVGTLSLFYRLDLRVEDFLISLLGLLTLAMVAKGFSLPGIPSLEKSFLLFLLVAQVSIFNGIFFHTVDKPLLSFFYLLKWVEYFVVFLVTARLTVDEKRADFFLKIFFVSGLAVATYGYWEYIFPASKALYPNYYRLFERPPFHGDANHIGGFLVLWIGFFTGLFLKTDKARNRTLFLASLLFVFFPLVWTYSRKSYFALGGALAFPFLLGRDRRKLLLLISLFVILAFLLPTRLSERLTDLKEDFASVDPFHSSWATNWVMWKNALWNFERFFLFGSGLGSRHRLFYESQYVLTLAETGVVGLTVFLFLLGNLFRSVFSSLRARIGPKGEGIALGWLIGFVGLLIHSFSLVSWTVSKISIPFWFLTAVVLVSLKQMKGANG